jgi:hypothetical protein
MDVPAKQTSDQLSTALGDAVATLWSSIPHDIQHRLFEEVVMRRGEHVRLSLAVYLHDRHPRTCAAIRARAILEPDSLGG